MLWSFLLTQGTSTGMAMNMQCSISTSFILHEMEIPSPVVNTLLSTEGKNKNHNFFPLCIFLTHIGACLRKWKSDTHCSKAELADLTAKSFFVVVQLFSLSPFSNHYLVSHVIAWQCHHSINMSCSLGNKSNKKNTSWECKKASRSVAWRTTIPSTGMKYEITKVR